MKKLKLGIIGAGRIGNVHARSITYHVPEADLIAIADIAKEKAQKLALDLGIPNVYSDYKKILENSDIDAVLICTPTDIHADLCIEAAKAGKHIFCEKPIDVSVDKILKVIETVKKYNVKMQVGFNRRFDHNHNRLHKVIKEGKLGDILTINITSRDPALPPINFLKSSGGMFLDMSIHDFDMAGFLAGSIVEEVYVKAAVRVDESVGSIGDVDTAVCLLKLKNGVLATINNCRATAFGYDQRIEVFGSKGMATADNDTETNVTLYCDNGVVRDKPLYFFLERYMQSFAEEMKQFVDAVINGKQIPVTCKDALYPVLIALAARKSVDENRPVKIEEIYDLSSL
jgi:myo-inositol 2-dehydrogenase/D-chiro-inositol 1-dehydrogenase